MHDQANRRDQFSVRLPPTLRAELDALARQKSVPRNALMIQLLELGLKRQRQIDAIVEAVA